MPSALNLSPPPRKPRTGSARRRVPSQGSQVTDTEVGLIAQRCCDLRRLNLHMCYGLTDRAICAVARLPELQSLNVSGCYKLTDRSMRALAQLPMLRRLDISCCDQISDVGVIALLRGPQLQSDAVSIDPVSTDPAKTGRTCAGSSLRCLHISDCDLLTDATIEAVCSHCPQLKVLGASDLPRLTALSLRALHNSGLRLKQLDIEGSGCYPHGRRVEGLLKGRWHKACVLLENDDGTFELRWDSGPVSSRFPAKDVRRI